MKTLSKALVATVTAGGMVMAAVTPAQARDARERRHGGISAGEVIAGAVVLGGLAAVLSSSHRNRDYRSGAYGSRDRYYSNRDYRGGYDNPRYAVEQCVRAAQRNASYRTGGQARVNEVRDINRTRHGLQVRGTIAVQQRHYRGRYDRYNHHDRYGRNYRNARWDRGSFSCQVRGGRVTDVNFYGIRHLR